MKMNIRHLIDFTKVDALLEGFNKSTGFVTAILDLEGTVLSKSGWRPICTEFHRINPETSKRCTISDTVLANKMGNGQKYHAYKCLNGLMDVAVPLKINGEHVANLFSGQFFFETPDIAFFKEQAAAFGFDEKKYLDALSKVPVVSEEKVKTAMDFLLDMTLLISDLAFQKLEQEKITQNLIDNEQKFKAVFESANAGKLIILPSGEIIANESFCKMLGYTRKELENIKWQNLTHEKDIPISIQIFESLITGEKDSDRFEKQYICKNGSYLWADVSVSIRRDNKGKPLHFITTVIDITERKQVEEKLKQAALLLQSSIESPKDMIILSIDQNYNYLYFNECHKLSMLYAYGQDVKIGMNLLECITSEEDRIKAKINYDKALNGESHITIQEFGDIEKSHYETRYNPIFNDKNEIIGTTAFSADITYRRQTEVSLRESEERYRLLTENMKDVVWILDTETGHILYVSPNVEKLRGYTSDEIMAEPLSEAIVPAQRQAIGALIANRLANFNNGLLTQSDFFTDEVLQPCKDGSTVWTEVVTNYSRDKKSGHVMLQGTTRDISERKQAEEKLRESESRFRKLYEDGANGMVMAGKDFKFLMANRTFCQMTGYQEEELQQLTFADITHQDDRAKDILHIKKMMAGEIDVYRTEKRYVKKDGQTFWVQLTVSPIYNSSGLFLYFVGIIVNITERKNAELDLVRMSRIMKNSQEIAHLGSFEYVAADQSTIWSEEEYRIYGLDPTGPSPAYNVMLEKCIHPDDEKLLHNTFMAAIQNQGVYELEHRIVRPDGSVRWVYDKAHPYFDENGNLLRYVGATLDTTEHKLAEVLLNESEKKFRNLFQNHAAVKLIIDPENGNIVEANKAAVDFYGWTIEELQKMNIGQINTLPAAALKKEMGKILSLKKTNFELKHQKADGSLVDVEVFSSSVDIDGKQYLHSIIQDISEKKKAQKELIINEQLLASVMDTQQELICRFLPDTTLTFVNKAYCKIFGMTEEELFGRKFLELVPESEWETIFSNLKRLKEENPQITYESSAFKADGSVITIEWTDIAIFNKKGEVVEFQSVGHDITEKLKTLRELIIAKEKAEASDKLKTAFINNISHEIRTPLNGILGFGQFLVESGLSDKERVEIFKRIELSSNRLMNTVTDYIDIARIVSGTMEIHFKEFELQPLFEEIIENKKQLYPDIKINFEVEIPIETDGLTVNSDIEFVGKILGKLLDNAFKFTQHGSIKCGYAIKPGFVEFFVRDTGNGITGDKLELMFEMFTQEDSSMTRGYEGSGLGLAIAKGLTTLLGGEINVVSVIGEGSTFIFTIPVNNPKKSGSSNVIKTNKIKYKEKPLILIAEDDESNYKYLAVILDSIGYNHIHAVNGAEAVDFCRQNPDISIVLMDIKMPVMNGLEATKFIHEIRPELHIIATTAYAQTGDKHRFTEAGCNDYISKPIKKEKLLSLIRKYVD